jgi:ABC-type lipoprotein release transport system permease subunit
MRLQGGWKWLERRLALVRVISMLPGSGSAEPLDTSARLVTAGILIAVVEIATLVPALRATRIDPIGALRVE